MWDKRINVAVIVLTCLLVVIVLFPMIQQAREAARKTQSKYNLKRIGLALDTYADGFQGFPPGGIFNREGRGYHGWMTSTLPYFDASYFFNLVDFNEPWDSGQNAGLFLNPKEWYENPSEPKSHRHWEFPVAHYSANSHLMAVNSFIKLKSIENTVQLFLVGELDGDFLPWGCPYNWRELDRLNSIPATYGRSTRDGCQFVFADGRVEFIANNVSKDILKRMSGDDLAGFKSNSLNIQRPSTFPCPTDALIVSWRADGMKSVVVRSDMHGNVKSEKRVWGKMMESEASPFSEK